MIKNTFIKLYNYFCFFASLCFNIIFVEYISVCLQKQLPQVLCKKKVILKNFANFTEKHLCWSLFFNRVAALKVYYFTEKETPLQLLSWEYRKFFKNSILFGTPPVAASETGWRISKRFLGKICTDFLWLRIRNNINWSYYKHGFLCNSTIDHLRPLKFRRVLCARTEKYLPLKKGKEAQVAVNREKNRKRLKNFAQ